MALDNDREPIAVIGLGCRFPQAAGIDAFWRLMMSERDPIEEVPDDRFDIDAYYDPRPEQSGKIVTRKGGFLSEIRRFDASLFGISSREATRMDPQQRLLLEVTHEALEDGGQKLDEMEGTETGVFVGMIANEYRDLARRHGVEMDVYAESGTARAAASGRVSHAFGLNGPSMTVDTACSSSLVATHLACESIRSGGSEMAIVGGTNLILEPEASIAFSSTGMLAADGHCKFGDARADGFTRSDGIGVVVLKPLADALRDDDRVRAVIWETATNNDGRSGDGFFLTPSRDGQTDLLERTYRRRDGLRRRVDYVEAHGTGTRAGDPVEIGALSDVLAEGVEREEPLLVGSVKSNIGHTEGAAGVAGLIKSVLVLEHGRVPRTLHLQEPNPDIPWDDIDVRVPDETRALDRERPLIAGVSAFGISGTNAHVVLEEWREQRGRIGRRLERAPDILPIAAHTDESLDDYTRDYAAFLGADDGGERDSTSTEICGTAARRRSHRRHRLAVVGEDGDELVQGLEGALEEVSEAQGAQSSVEGKKRAFVFSGQGGQWPAMGRALLEEPVASEALERCDAAIWSVADWSVLETLAEPEAWTDDVGRIQPLLFATQIALAELWRDRGFSPDVVIGHSLGEVAAAHVAGHLSLEEAARVICTRSTLLRGIAGDGAMAVVGLSPEECRAQIEEIDGEMAVGVQTEPGSCVVSGTPPAVAALCDRLEVRDVFCKPVEVDVASHSPQVEPLLEPLREQLSELAPVDGETPMYSTPHNTWIDGSELDADYWADNLRRPVQFAGAVQRLVDQGVATFVELSPHPVLTHPIRQIVREHCDGGVVVPSMRRDEAPSRIVHESLAELYECGAEIDWSALYGDGVPVDLPSYPFRGEDYWFESGTSETPRTSVRRRPAGDFEDDDRGHPFFERQFRLGAEADISVWETTLTTDRFWYLDEHRVRGSVVFPGAAYTEMACAAARELFDGDNFAVESITFDEILVVPDESERRLQLIAEQVGPNRYRAEFYSFDPEVREAHQESTGHATAELVGDEAVRRPPSPPVFNGSNLAESGMVFSPEDFYELMHDRGIEDGPAFRSVDLLRYDDERVEGELEIPESIRPELGQYVVHPAVLDGIFQLIGPVLMSGRDGLFLPAEIGRLIIHQAPSTQMRGVAIRNEDEQGNHVTVDIRVFDERGEPVVDLEGFDVRRVRRQSPDDDPVGEWFHRWRWERDPECANLVPVRERDEGGWLVFSDVGGIGARLCEALEDRGTGCLTVWHGNQQRVEDPDNLVLDAGSADASDYRRLLEVAETHLDGLTGIAFLWSADTMSAVADRADGGRHQLELVMGAFHLARAIEEWSPETLPKLSIATIGARDVGAGAVGEAVEQAPIWGVARVLRNEMPELETTCIDLEPDGVEESIERFAHELLVDDAETEVAFREGARYVHRLERFQPEETSPDRRTIREQITARDQFVLGRSEPSTIDGLHVSSGERAELGPNEIEIDVRATGLNFADVVTAMGLMDRGGGQIGYECVGVVSRVGEAVDDQFRPGIEVMAFAPSANCFGGYATVDADLAVEIPEQTSLREAATIPTVYLTAYYGLVEEGNLASGERVLIHSASGGVGHAALYIAREIGAEIYVTAGTERKREYLREEFGLEHVMDSRSLDFADEIEALTGGEGVDVVLNTLTGEGTRRGFELLRPLGRFLDLSKADMYEQEGIDLDPFEKNLSYVGIDITKVAAYRPSLIASMWERIRKGFRAGAYRSLPVDSVFGTRELSEAFRYMRRGVHIGKIVVEQDVETIEVEHPVDRETMFRADGSYVLTGGTGGLGLEVADWMSQRNAGHLVLISRSGAGEAAADRIEAIRERGTEVTVARGDVTDGERIRTILAETRAGDGPIRGVFHLAAVLDDATIPNQTAESLRRAFEPKAVGAWHLHTLTYEDPLDYFVLFSSAATVLGSPGQANYAAANEFLDALACARRRDGRPALSLDWGQWTEVGLAAARDDRGTRLEARGLEGITPERGLEALERALMRNLPPSVGVFGIDWTRWAQSFPQVRDNATFGDLLGGDAEDDETEATGELVDNIRDTDEEGRGTLVAHYLRRVVSNVLGRSASKIDFGQPVSRIGLDSLMVVELRVRLEDQLGIELSRDAILKAGGLEQLTDKIVDELKRP